MTKSPSFKGPSTRVSNSRAFQEFQGAEYTDASGANLIRPGFGVWIRNSFFLPMFPVGQLAHQTSSYPDCCMLLQYFEVSRNLIC